MRVPVESRILAAVAMAALAFSVSCGGGGGNNDGASGNPTPTRTAAHTPTPTHTEQAATPAPSATPPGLSTASVVFDLSAGTTIIAASADVTYDRAKGSFAGSGSGSTECAISTSDMFVPNDNGILKLGLNSAAGLDLPASITCTFDEIAGPLTASDLTITSKTVAVLDASGIPVAGDSNALAVRVTVTQAR